MLARGVGNFRALDSFRRNLEEPREDNGNGKAKDDEKNNRADCPVWNIEHGKNLGNSLGKRPARDDVRNGDLVNIAPLQLGEKITHIHFTAMARPQTWRTADLFEAGPTMD
jgi:hypothetical protein